ncbi:hypothetical protein ACHAXT_001099 [Thalassiosira profunda]
MTHHVSSSRVQSHSAEWIDLLSPASYSSATFLPGTIDPPRSGAVSFSSPDDTKLFTHAGYAELEAAPGEMPERFVVNDMWQFLPHSSDDATWGWTKVLQSGGIPGPRLATALAVLPDGDGDASKAVLLGGWDPQTPGTGGVILDDVSMLDLGSLEWSKCESTVPGGPTSRHVAVPLLLSGEGGARNVICLHNHRCEDHVLLLSATDGGVKWKNQPVTGDVPSSRGLHCAAQLNIIDGKSKGIVIFGGAAKDGNMSNEAYVLNANAWKWTKLDCGNEDDVPSPRAGACLCPLDENTVVLFGGATPGEGGLIGLNDVWLLHVDASKGKGRWECLSRSSSSGVTVQPPGRNAATLSPIDATKLLPDDLIWKGDEGESSYYLLQGGWYPFRKTYSDAFLLRISPN